VRGAGCCTADSEMRERPRPLGGARRWCQVNHTTLRARVDPPPRPAAGSGGLGTPRDGRGRLPRVRCGGEVARAFLRPGSTPAVHSNPRKRGVGHPGGAARITRHRCARAQEGQLEVLVGGAAVRELGPGECFGEIGLLLLGTCTARAPPPSYSFPYPSPYCTLPAAPRNVHGACPARATRRGGAARRGAARGRGGR